MPTRTEVDSRGDLAAPAPHARPTTTAERQLAFGQLQLDPATGDLRDPHGLVPLTPKALALLTYLVVRAGCMVSTGELLDAVWPGVFVSDGALKVCIREIRRVLGDDARDPRFIETAHRRGYRFIASVTEMAPAAPRGGPQADPPPPTTVQYARSGDVNVAYQVLGSGPLDLVFVMGWVSHLEYYWREPSFARFLQRLAGCSRLILFDKRGTGLSDPVMHMPTLEQRMDDVRAVMDAVGSERAVLLGVSEGGPLCSLFAATYPNRTEALVMIGTYARRLRAPDYPWAPTDEQREAFCREILVNWGGPVGIETRAPSMARDPAFRDWWATYLRMGASPAAAVALTRMNAQIDVRHILPTVRVPTLVLHRTGDRCLLVEEGRYVASRIPHARFVELPGDDHLPFVGDANRMLHEIERFLRQRHGRPHTRRMLATMLCLTPDGRDEPAGGSMDGLHEMACLMSARFGHAQVQRRDHGVVVLFDGPARAIRCGCAIRAAAAKLGWPVKMGVHAGECDVVGGSAQGLAVEICQRLAERARGGEVLVSRTVVDLVAGSGLRFIYRGAYRLADAPDHWQVFSAAVAERDEDIVVAMPPRGEAQPRAAVPRTRRAEPRSGAIQLVMT
ncbi:MAG: alpha/beta fold hydrolase, partial [Vicinamibacteraceae bacterium]